MRALWAALVAAFLIITTAPVAGASEIYTIDIDAEIQADGSAIITDTRTFEATEGTEHYISIGSLRDSDVHSLSVVLDGQPLTDIGDWDVNASRREKAGKSGVVDTGDGYELSFGFGEYGRHTAVMTYTVTNFVYTLSDGAQTVFWQFLPRNMTDTKFVSISLRNTVGVTHTHENTRIWGFGYEGESVITTNSLRLATSKPITSNNHMTMLAIFPEPLFTSNGNRPEDTESLIKRAKEGSDWEDSNPLNVDSNDLFSKAITVIGAVVIFGILGYVGRAFLVAFGTCYGRSGQGRQSVLTVGQEPPEPKASIGEKSLTTARSQTSIPCAAMRYQTSPPHYYSSGFTKAHFAKCNTKQDGCSNAKKQPSPSCTCPNCIPTSKPHTGTSSSEPRATTASYNAKKSKNSLVRTPPKSPNGKPRHSIIPANARSNSDCARSSRKKERVFFINYIKKEFPLTQAGKELTQAGKDMRNKIDGFKNYLRDFSLLNERTASNVLLWDAYMIWAGYLGIAEEVAKQFNITDPAYAQQTSISPTAVATGTYFSNRMDSVYTDATTSSSSSSSSSSSGRGGSSSVGGGSGSSGGGSGGGIR
ncbi:DUF2207 family protein [Actinobaculum suis]|nr:DUF2207 domain-containing protein [Actinobaculum suis]OCA95418.1 hypothetical protein ACU20_04195 [Actinobaculum suis]